MTIASGTTNNGKNWTLSEGVSGNGSTNYILIIDNFMHTPFTTESEAMAMVNCTM